MFTVAPSGLSVGQLLWRKPIRVRPVPKRPIASTIAAAMMIRVKKSSVKKK